MPKTYIVEVLTETITPITLEAETHAEAAELVESNVGQVGQTYPGVTRIFSVKCVDAGDEI